MRTPRLTEIDMNSPNQFSGDCTRIFMSYWTVPRSASSFGLVTINLIPRGQTQSRALQFATVIAGVSYFDLLPVDFAVTARAASEFGSIQGRDGRRAMKKSCDARRVTKFGVKSKGRLVCHPASRLWLQLLLQVGTHVKISAPDHRRATSPNRRLRTTLSL